jgi:tetracycline resistance efflux pump
MVLPLVSMMLGVFFVLYATGQGNLMEGDGSKAVLWGVISGLLVAAVLYRVQGIMTLAELSDGLVEGIKGLTPLVVILALAFTISATTREMGTGEFLAGAARAALHPGFVPALIFSLACFIAFSTGTSWGTFAIMIPIVVPMAGILDLELPLVLGAAMGGGIFGDHCSPISDSTIVASMAAATDHIEHVRTQLPYALAAAVGAVALFLVFGFVY